MCETRNRNSLHKAFNPNHQHPASLNSKKYLTSTVYLIAGGNYMMDNLNSAIGALSINTSSGGTSPNPPGGPSSHQGGGGNNMQGLIGGPPMLPPPLPPGQNMQQQQQPVNGGGGGGGPTPHGGPGGTGGTGGGGFAPFVPRQHQPVTYTAGTFAQTKFGSTKLKSNGKKTNRMSPTEFSNYIKQRAMQKASINGCKLKCF